MPKLFHFTPVRSNRGRVIPSTCGIVAKSWVKNVRRSSTTRGITSGLSPALSPTPKTYADISPDFAPLYTSASHKFSQLNFRELTDVRLYLSTFSTPPITTITI